MSNLLLARGKRLRAPYVPPVVIEPFVADFFVSALGLPTNDGTEASPWNVEHLSDVGLIPAEGADVEVLGGVFRGDYFPTFSNVRLRVRAGQRAIFDGEFDHNGDGCWFWDTEHVNQNPLRFSQLNPALVPTDLGNRGYTGAQSKTGVGNKWVNNVIRDTDLIITGGQAAIGTEFIGITGYNNGWHGPDRPHGHLTYLQNDAVWKKVLNCILFHSFMGGMRVGGTNDTRANHVLYDKTTVIEPGGAEPSDLHPLMGHYLIYCQGAGDFYPGGLGYITASRCHLYFRTAPNYTETAFELQQTGAVTLPAIAVFIEDSIIQGINVGFGPCLNSGLRRNKISTGRYDFSVGIFGESPIIMRLPNDAAFSTLDNDYNDIYAEGLETTDQVAHVRLDGVDSTYLTLEEWTAATGWDQNSTLTRARPSAPDIFVDVNPIEPNRGDIKCWNWGLGKITGVAATDVLTRVAHGLSNGEEVGFCYLDGGAGLVTNVRYFIRDATADTFKLADTEGGVAKNFTTDITAATTLVPMNLVIPESSARGGISDIISVGDKYVIHHVFDLFGPPVLAGTYAGGSITLPQLGFVPPKPIGSHYTPEGPEGEMNAFLIREVAITTVPAAPSGFAAAPGADNTKINLTWTDNSTDESGFIIEREQAWDPNAVGVGTDWIDDGIVGPGVTSHTSHGLLNSTLYNYRVRAYNEAGHSTPSTTDSATTAGPGAAFVDDTMTDVAGTLITAHTGELGATYTKHPSQTGDAQISATNTLRPTNTAAVMVFASGTPPGPDYDVLADYVFKTNLNQRMGICARMSTTVAQLLLVQHDGIWWKLIRFDPTAGTKEIGVFGHTLTNATTYAIKLEVRGPTVKLFIDGVLILSANDWIVGAAGKAGIRCTNQTGASDTTGGHIDNFRTLAA